ncbi:MAG: hypothetical protein R2861_10205 [Desulfobacterales bacterium]
MSLANSPITRLADKNVHGNFNIRNIYHGSATATHLAASKPYITPINISAVPGLFLKHQLPLNAAFIQTSPPDDFGWMSLGISVDVCLAAIKSAELVIAQVNPKMPRCWARVLCTSMTWMIVEQEEDLLHHR